MSGSRTRLLTLILSSLCFIETSARPQMVSVIGETGGVAELLESIDETVDPCQDFYRYACGKWIAKNPMPKSASSWTRFDVLDRQLVVALRRILEKNDTEADARPLRDARLMYRACIDTATLEKTGLKPLTDLLGRFGGWPVTLDKWNETSFNWLWTSAVARSTYGAVHLISISNGQDQMNATKRSIYIDQGHLILPRASCLNLTDSSETSTAYKDYAKAVARAISKSLGSSVSDEQIASDVEGVALFESRLANITTSDEERRNVTRMYNPMLLNELQSFTDRVNNATNRAKINWSRYLNMIYETVNTTIPNNERVIVCEKEYLKQLIMLIDQTPPRVLANYLLWRIVYDWATETNQLMRDLRFKFYQIRYGITEAEDRNDVCTTEVNDLLGYALSAEYVKEAFDERDNKAVGEMVADLKSSFKSLVDEAAWMSNSTKETAKNKVDAMIEQIGYPRWITNKTALENYYAGISVSESSHFENVFNVESLITRHDLSNLRLKPNRNEWNTYPSVTNAFYSDETNAITFPAAILQPPFFVRGRLAAMNYGAIGSVIGHEITHGFDDKGRQSDKFGQTAQWWTGETLDSYLAKMQCFIDQYANYSTPSGQNLNGVNTQGENVADNGGLREAFRAYRLYVARNGREPGAGRLTAEQLFFVSFANNYCGSQTERTLADRVLVDEHSPERHRVVGALSNSHEFAAHFKCPANAPMNPANKCILW